MSEAIVLEVQKRNVIGKKVKQLRAQGQIPAIVYGPGRESVPITIDWTRLRQVLLEAGGTHLVELKANGDSYMTLIRQVDRHPMKHDMVLHVDFYIVDLATAIVTAVPVVLANEEDTEVRIGGRIIPELSSIEVETLPASIPAQIVVDVSGLNEIGDIITVGDLPELDGVTYMADAESPVVRTEYISTPVEEEEEVEEESILEEMAEPTVISRRADEEFEEESDE